MKYIDPVSTQSWKNLKLHFNEIKNVHLKDFFKTDTSRFNNFSFFFKNKMLIDFSKNRITRCTINYLLQLAREMNLEEEIQSMFSGKKINYTENRSVLHVLLRNRNKKTILVNGENIVSKVNYVLEKMKNFSEKVISGEIKGYTGKTITDIVNIGIGGSSLGPNMVIEALSPYKNHLNIHFVSNIDGTHINQVLKKINSKTTLFLVASKTFTTEETMINAYTARNWFLEKTGNIQFVKKHFIALSMNFLEVKKFGIIKDYYFEFWDWVGGRYSLWSSIGLSIILSIGFKNFVDLLSGANDMDQHFLNSDLEDNIPVILALISIWYNNFFKFETEAIFAYDQNLNKLATYLQQLNMESNGKSVSRNGIKVNWETGPIIWGEAGTNGQHAFYQLMHQGTKIIPSDFIAAVNTHDKLYDHHKRLFSHFLAQTKSLAFGKSIEELKENFLNEKMETKEIEKIVPFRIFEGNRPSNSFLFEKITPYNLGLLLSVYEHKVFTQGIIFNIFSFDQWGVELGKKAANNIFSILKENKAFNAISYDSSTRNLINAYYSWIK
ncbi:Glucose-6-phosphate isomerase [Buchnera aphidicola (Tetraneura ulmi)]|uniref:glucose-6-phosphate isomerase n=1 Tax=Buchnera aphidicola TaxID=9 RepID=UPI003464AF3D